MTVTVYTSPSCVQCNATKRQLKLKNQPYDPVDVTENQDAYDFITKELGYIQVPVVVVKEGERLIDHWSGFRPDRLKAVLAAAAA